MDRDYTSVRFALGWNRRLGGVQWDQGCGVRSWLYLTGSRLLL